MSEPFDGTEYRRRIHAEMIDSFDEELEMEYEDRTEDKLAGLEREVFAAVFLDTRHRLIEYVELFQGTIDGAEVHPREVVRQALRCNAAAVIVAHNHPSGTTDPSAADRAVTTRLKQALALVDVRLLDHIVVGAVEPRSMAAAGSF